MYSNPLYTVICHLICISMYTYHISIGVTVSGIVKKYRDILVTEILKAANPWSSGSGRDVPDIRYQISVSCRIFPLCYIVLILPFLLNI